MSRMTRVMLRLVPGLAGGIAVGLALAVFLPAWPRPLLAIAIALETALVLWLSSLPAHVESKRMVRTTAEDAHFKDAILRFVTESAHLHERTELYNLLLETAVDAIPEAAMGSLLKSDHDGYVHFETAFGHDMRVLGNLRLREAETFIHVLTQGRCDHTVIVNDYRQLNRSVLDEERYKQLEAGTANLSTSSILSAPVRIDGELWGILNIDSAPGCQFKDSHITKLDVFVNEMVKVIRMFREQERTLWLMRHDALTGMLNRLHFTERFRKDLDAAGQGACFGTLVSIDLDGFKSINDRYGHVSGDLALTHFSAVFSGRLSPDDYLSRYGGDEFMAVLKGIRSNEAERLMQAIGESFHDAPLLLSDEPVVIRFSYGLAEFDQAHHDHKELLHQSDAHMYANKKEKKETHR